MNKRHLTALAGMFTIAMLASCSIFDTNGNNTVATPTVNEARDAQFATLATADAQAVAVVPTATIPPQPTATPEPAQQVAAASPTVYTLNVFVTPVEAVEVTQ